MKFNLGDAVIIVDGDFKGNFGRVEDYVLERYLVKLDPESPDGTEPPIQVACVEEDLDILSDEDSDEENVTEVPVYDFGISQELLNTHLEWLISRSLEKLGSVGAKEAFFGFQEFEGKTASQVLLDLMGKLEEGVVMFAQAHVLIGRIVMALESINNQNHGLGETT